MSWSDFYNVIPVYGQLLAAIVTAVATIFLWKVTAVLAIETRRMVDASSQPHVVVTIEPNRWALNHADINVNNTGNAPAYDINISFSPDLPSNKKDQVPLQRVSILRPGQSISSYLTEFSQILGNSYVVSVSWRRNPAKDIRENNEYTINMKDLEGLHFLGERDPLTQVADQLKKMQEMWNPVARGTRRIAADIFTSGDRLHERRQYDRWYRHMMQEQERQKTLQTEEQGASDSAIADGEDTVPPATNS